MNLNPLSLAIYRAGGGNFRPTWLFADGSPGFTNSLVPNTLATVFDGSTQPATGDPIGRMDNLVNSYDALQPTSPERPTLGEFPYGVGVVNLAQYSEDFSNDWWQKNAGSISSVGDTIAGLPAQRFTLSGGSAQHRITRNSFWPTGQTNCLAWYVVDVSGMGTKFATISMTNPATTGRFTWDAPQTISTTGSAGGTQGYVILGDYQALIWHCSPSARSSAGASSLFFGAFGNYSGDGEYGVVARAQFEFGSTAPSAYQKVTAAAVVTQAGIASVPRSWYQTDDWIGGTLPAPIDISTTGAMLAFAGFHNTGVVSANQYLLSLGNSGSANPFLTVLIGNSAQAWRAQYVTDAAAATTLGSGAATTLTSGLVVVLVWVQGGTLYFRINGTEFSGAVTAGACTIDRFTLAALGRNTVSGFANASIAPDPIVYIGPVTAQMIAQTEQYLKAKVGAQF